MTQTAARPQLAYLTAVLDALRANGTHSRLRVLDDQQAPVCHYDGKQVINLASNNYLGLANHPKLIEAALQATRELGVGSGAVRTIAGTMRIHMDLEEKIARFKNVEACVVFQSGFAANGYGEHSPGHYGILAALVSEVVMTMVFLFVIMGSTHGKAPAGHAPLAIGLCLVLIHLVSIPVTNTSVNPARSTGPALFVGGWALAQLWLFWVAPLVGGVLGGVIYRWLSDEPSEQVTGRG